MARAIPVILGPTAVGKTELSLSLARAFDAEIVGGDSRQIYRYLDIGTAKPDGTQRRAAPHHLIDVRNPHEALNAAQFARLAWGCIQAIEARHRQPLVVGGSGLYLRALTDGLFVGPSASPGLRAALEAEASLSEVGRLHRRLAEVDPTAASRIHPNDRVRIIRALEVYTLTGTPISQLQCQWQPSSCRQAFVLIGLARTREELRQRVAMRTQAMLGLGLVTEVKGLLDRGISPRLPVLQSVGYGEIVAYLAGAFDLSRAQELIERNTWRLAKRQMTWFRRIAGVHWISLTGAHEGEIIKRMQAIVATAWENQAGMPVRGRMAHQVVQCRCPVPT